MLIREVEEKKRRCLLIRRGQLYGLLRRSQKRILERNFSRFREFSERDTFRRFARILTEKFFPETVKKGAAVEEYIERAYVDWLILAPLIASYKWLPKPGMHRGHYLTWARRACNKQTRQWFFVRVILEVPDREELARRATINACELVRLNDVYWLEEEFSFLAWLAHSGGLKGRLARWILFPWAFLDVDHEYDEVLGHSLSGWEKEVARAGKKGSASYFRLGNEIWIFATREVAERVQFPWVDLRERRSEALEYEFWYEEGVRYREGRKRLSGGLQIALRGEILRGFRNEAKAIAHHRSMNPHYKLYRLNELAKDFIQTHRYAVSAGMQFLELGRLIKDLVQSKIAPTLGPDAVKKGIYPGPQDIDRSLYFRKLNPFYETKEPSEEEYILWWTPYQP